MKNLVRATVATAAAILLTTLTFSAPASAHVETSGMADGGRTMVHLTVEHGCGDLDLTGLRVQMPTGATQITAEDPAGWTNVVSAAEIVWSGGPQPAHEELEFEFTLKLSQAAGEPVYFPAIETCPGGEVAWIELPVEGQPEPEHPAASIVVGGTTNTTAHAAMDDDHSSTASSSAPVATMAPVDSPITREGTTTNNAGLVVLLIVMAIIIGGGVILYLRNRKPAAKN
jgi:uncharacterized protein YcnI